MTGCSCRSSAMWTSSRSAGSTGRSRTWRRGRAPASSGIDDFGGSTFTIDNTGWFGSNLTMPTVKKFAANSQVRAAVTHGVLKLTLHATNYDWEFIPVERRLLRRGQRALPLTR